VPEARRLRPASLLSCFLAGLALAVLPAQAEGATAERRVVQALPLEEPISVDGRLDEPAWQRADVARGFTQREPTPGAPASDDTEVRIAYTETDLYIGIHAFASGPGPLIAGEMQRDSTLSRDDSVVVLLDTFHDGRNAYWFETNANGARADALVTDEGRDFNLQWDGVWRAAAVRTADGWTAELAIPFSTVRFAPGLGIWGLNVRRLIRARNEETYWAPVPLAADAMRVSLEGDLVGLASPRPGLDLRVKPFAVGAERRFAEPSAAGADEKLDLGLDVKWGITRNLALDLTYKTDFAEAEVDDQQVNLTRFSLFFPEKREFFLENAGIFEFGFNSPDATLLKVFFSRRIGNGPGGIVVPIDYGARLTGRIGEWSIGALDVESGSAPLEDGGRLPRQNEGVVRLKRNVGERSTLGMIFTRVDEPDGGANQVLGFDADLHPSRESTLAAFWTESSDPGAVAGSRWAGGVSTAWQGETLGLGFDATEVGAGYNPGLGFLLREGIRHYEPRFTYLPRPVLPGVRNLVFTGSLDIYTDLMNRIETRYLAVDVLGVRFQSEDEVKLFADSSFERVPAPFALSPGVVIPAGSYRFNDVGFRLTSNSGRTVGLDGYVIKGQFYDGDRLSGSANLALRASRYLRSDTTWAHDDVHLPGGSFKSDIVRERLAVSLTPDLFANTFVQYNTAASLLSLNFRFDWTYRPGADLFVILNQDWGAPTLSRLAARNRAVIVKLTYLLQY
jgi:uncharacterized protein DUF5916